MTMNDILDTVSTEEAAINSPWSDSDNAIRTSKKEIIGNRLITKNRIIPTFYGERCKHITDKDKQIKGTDFKTFSHNIDVKVSIGDFTDDSIHYFECVPVEIMQNQKITFTDDKDTTDLLFVNVNINTEEVHFLSVPYQFILKIVRLNLSNDPFSKMNSLYIPDQRTSMNGSGLFIKMPIYRLIDYPGVYYFKQRLNLSDLTHTAVAAAE